MNMTTIENAIATIALALSLAWTGPASGRTAREVVEPTSARPRPSTMDVAGVRLGMPLDATQAALAGAYRCDRPLRSPSFRQLVDREVGKRRGVAEGFGPDGAAVGELVCTGPSGEYLRLFMAQTSGGTVVDRIDLTIGTGRVDPGQLIQQIAGKYGRPTEGTAANGSWCSARCGYDLTMEPEPRITVRSDAWYFKILGSRGRSARLADDAAVKAAAAREAPAARRGAL